MLGLYDIFFSHAWADKCVLSYIYSWLTDLGYRVWYDQNDMGNNIPKSMSEGIRNSKIVLVCANSTYQGRPNCMFELRETTSLYPEKIVTLLVEGQVDKTSKISCLPPKKIWASSSLTVSKEMQGILKFSEMMYCHIGVVAQDKRWKSPDQIPPELVVCLLKAVQPLVSILNNAGCQPSMPRKGLQCLGKAL